jgi:hypothetical protein
MTRRARWWALLCCATGVLACENATTDPVASGGNAGSGTSGGSAGSAVMSAGAGGSTMMSGGSAGQSMGGGGASSGASTGGAGTAGSAGNGGAGGDSNTPMLPKRVLLYHFSTLVINSVPAQLTLLETQLETWGYEVEQSEDPADLNATNLARFGGVGMINTCFEPFGAGQSGEAQTAALEAFVANGGGLFGTHCATVTFQSAEPPHAYNGVIGGRGGHGFFEGLSACRTTEQHVTSAMLPATFDYTGNLDNADYLAPDTKVLVMCKWSGGEMKDTAVSWYRTPGKGRVFYTNFAKEDKDLSDATLGAKHILLGLGWVLGR